MQISNVSPHGATPLDPDEIDDLIPAHISTQSELNAWEQLNIAKGAEWLKKRGRRQPLLSREVVCELHRRMFADTWTWAGLFRSTMKNIGVAPEAILEQIHNLLADTNYWIEQHSFAIDEIACRFHHRLVAIHPFPNGNGRHARLMTDGLLTELGVAEFTWGSGTIDHQGDVRERYLAALRLADRGDYTQLLVFVRG